MVFAILLVLCLTVADPQASVDPDLQYRRWLQEQVYGRQTPITSTEPERSSSERPVFRWRDPTLASSTSTTPPPTSFAESGDTGSKGSGPGHQLAWAIVATVTLGVAIVGCCLALFVTRRHYLSTMSGRDTSQGFDLTEFFMLKDYF